MIKPLRKKHLQIWIAGAVLIPIIIISAVAVRPTVAKDKLLQPAPTAALPLIIKSVDKDNYTISIRSNSDTTQLQLITLQLIAGTREVKKDSVKYDLKKNGFTKVCNVNDIEEDRAKMFCLETERIAIFKTQGKLFAVNNVCKHQNGPLGEGKILDGCITDEFYMGWMPKTPNSFIGWIKKYLFVLLTIIIVLTVLLALSQKKFDTGTFEFGTLTEVKGIYVDKPVPNINVINGKNIWGNYNCITVLLISYGKHGADGIIADLEKEKNTTLDG